MATVERRFDRQFLLNGWRSLLIVSCFLVGLLVLAPGASGSTTGGMVSGHRKISATEGGFIGPLHDLDYFGGSVAPLGDFNGDGVDDLVVGASYYYEGSTNRPGAVWILLMDSDGTVTDEHKIPSAGGALADGVESKDYFGSSVVSPGDLNGDGVPELAVGAYGDDDGGPTWGAVWILFLDENGGVTSHSKIIATEGDPVRLFGWSLAALGDLDGDGVPDLAVGARNDPDGGELPGDPGGPQVGAVWIVFLNPDGTAKSRQKISATEGGFTGVLSENDHFGESVANLGDLNGDGIVDLAVGAPLNRDETLAKGAVWILFLNTDGTVASHAKISDRPGSMEGLIIDAANFGSSVASLGDLNGDGVPDVAVGADMDSDDLSRRPGLAWILFLNPDGTVAHYQRISPLHGGFSGILSDRDRFGSSLANLGDLNGDGVLDLAVGAEFDDDGGTNAGAVWILFLESKELPDLAVFANDISVSPEAPAVGEEVTIEALVRNQGAVSAENVEVRFLHFDTSVETVSIPLLLPGESAGASITTSFASDGLQLISVQVDSGKTILELDEQNNEAAKVFLLGDPDSSNAIIVVQASPVSTRPYCPTSVSGRADYDFDYLPGTQDFPVQGGGTTGRVVDSVSGDELSLFRGSYTAVDGLLRQPMRAPSLEGVYDLVVEVSDETLTGQVVTSLLVDGDPCDPPNGNGNGSPGPPDVYVRSQDIDFIPTNPARGEMTDLYTDIHYTASGPLDVWVRMNDLYPVNGELRTLQIADGLISFPDSATHRTRPFSTSWSTVIEGAHIIQAQAEPLGEIDQPTNNDQATRLIFVGELADITLEKSWTLYFDADENDVPSPGDSLEYTLTFTNTGLELRTGLVLLDDYDEALLLDPIAISGGGWVSGGTVVWSLGDLDAGASGEVSFEAELRAEIPLATEALVNTAFLDSDQTPAVAARVEIGLNAPPTADAGPDQSIRKGDLVCLDGRSSYDDNTPSDELLYTWSIVERPPDSLAELDDPSSPTPCFVADQEGLYGVQLVVTDEGALSSDPDEVRASSYDNLPPTAVADPFELAIVGTMVSLDGSESTDPESDTLYFSWSITEKPEGSDPTLIGADTPTPSFVPDVEDCYEVTLVVSDFIGPGDPAAVVVTAATVEEFPELQIVDTGNAVSELPPSEVTSQGNQTAFLEHLSHALRAIQDDHPEQAIGKLQKAISRTDGCALREGPDSNGPGRDWITDCAAQAEVYQELSLALTALLGL